MESTLIAAYVGLIIGYLIQNSEDYEQRVILFNSWIVDYFTHTQIREYLPSGDFKPVVDVLNKM